MFLSKSLTDRDNHAAADAVDCLLSSANTVALRCSPAGPGVGGMDDFGGPIARGTACLRRSLLSIATLFVHCTVSLDLVHSRPEEHTLEVL